MKKIFLVYGHYNENSFNAAIKNEDNNVNTIHFFIWFLYTGYKDKIIGAIADR